MEIHVYFQARASSVTSFFTQSFNLNPYTCVEKFDFNIFNFVRNSGILMIKKRQEVLLVLTYLVFETHFFSAFLLQDAKVKHSLNRKPLTWGELFNFGILEGFFKSESETWYDRGGKKNYQYRQIMVFQLIHFGKENSFWLLYKGLNWRSHTSRWLLVWTISDFVPLIEFW